MSVWATPCIDGKVDPDVLAEIVRRVVDVARPEKIILFGSAARGEMNRHSDVDLLVVKECENTCELTGQIYQKLSGVGAAVDVIIVSPQSVERYKDSHALVIKPAIREGTVVYEAPDITSRTSGPRDLGQERSSMSHPGRFPPDDPREWLNRARSNLLLAKSDLPGVYLENLCFNAQRAAETAIKAVMIARDIDFPYVHELERLLILLKDEGESIPPIVLQASKLTKYANVTRYPNDMVSVTAQDYAEATDLAEAVVRWAEERIQ